MNKDPDAQARFSEVQAAYDALSDPERRKLYDRFGHAGPAGVGGGGSAGWGGARTAAAGGPGAGSWRVEVDPADFSSVFDELFGGSGGEDGPAGPFGHAAGAAGRRTSRSVRGADIEQKLDIDFMTAALGGTRIVHLPDGDRIEVRVPAGAQQGAVLRVAGRGRPGSPTAVPPFVGRRDRQDGGRSSGPPGDLRLTINIAPHPWFRREGNDISIEVPITIAEAALGTTVTVPLLRGSIDLKVPPGTSSGRRLRVRGQGVSARDGVKGDFHAIITVAAPTDLTPADREALREIGERLPDPRATLPWASASDETE